MNLKAHLKNFKKLQKTGVFEDSFVLQPTFKKHLRWAVSSKIEPERIRTALVKDSKSFKNFKCFNDIYFGVYCNTYQIKGCGIKYCYELSRRIAFWSNIKPRILYVHKGNIGILRKLGLGEQRSWLEKSDLPEILRVLDMETLEKFLVYLKRVI